MGLAQTYLTKLISCSAKISSKLPTEIFLDSCSVRTCWSCSISQSSCLWRSSKKKEKRLSMIKMGTWRGFVRRKLTRLKPAHLRMPGGLPQVTQLIGLFAAVGLPPLLCKSPPAWMASCQATSPSCLSKLLGVVWRHCHSPFSLKTESRSVCISRFGNWQQSGVFQSSAEYHLPFR